MTVALAATLATFVSAGLLPVVKRFLLRREALDVPVGRSSHATPTVRGGGLAPLIAIVAGVLALGVLEPQVLLILPVVVAMGLLGLVEDLRGVPTAVRAALQVVIGAIGVAVLSVVAAPEWWVLVVGAISIAGYTNTVNFMDGIDGITALHASSVGATYAVLGFLIGAPMLAGVSLVFGLAFLCFLPWNILGSKMFLGDVGSYTLGAAVAATAIVLVFLGAPLLAVVAPCAIYLADTLSTLVIRIARRERWYEAHRSHAYQLLSDMLGGHLRTSLLVAAFSATTGAIGIASVVNPELRVSLWVAVALVAVAYVVGVRVVVARLAGHRTGTS